MTADYSPFDAIDELREGRRREEQQRDEEKRREEEWKRTWTAVFLEADVPAFLNLGKILREYECGFWLDYIEVCWARQQYVLELGLVPNGELSQTRHAYSVITIRLFKFAFLPDEESLANELDKIARHTMFNDLFAMIEEWRDCLESWLRPSSHRPTPFMSRKELAAALRDDKSFKGLRSRGSITTAIRDERIRANQECLPAKDGRTRYARFQHTEPEIHAAMLRHAVEFLKKKRKS